MKDKQREGGLLMSNSNLLSNDNQKKSDHARKLIVSE